MQSTPEIKSPLLDRKRMHVRRGSKNSPNGSGSSSPVLAVRNQARRGSLVSQKSVHFNQEPALRQRQRSASFGYATHLLTKPARLSTNLKPSGSEERVSKTGSNPTLCGDHSDKHDQQHCVKCSRLQRRSSLKPAGSDELVFDYVHGEIKHREKSTTAFGSTYHPEDKKPPKYERRSSLKIDTSKDEKEAGDEAEGDQDSMVSADDFINRCIIDVQTPRVKTAQKPSHTSSTFSQLLAEFMPEDGNHELPDVVAIPVIKQRGRSNSLPLVNWSARSELTVSTEPSMAI